MIFILFLVFVTAIALALIFKEDNIEAPPEELINNLNTYIHLYEAIESHYRLGIINETDRAELIKTLDMEAFRRADEHLTRLENDIIK